MVTDLATGFQRSSPVKVLPQHKEDVTINEITHRIAKRSHQPVGSSGLEPHEWRQPKRAKQSPGLDAPRTLPSISSTCSSDDVYSSAFTEDCLVLAEMLYKTPRPVSPSDTSVQSQLSEPQDFSPVPIAKRMLSRTSSRNLKENQVCHLASPFSSRPGSRHASPMYAPVRKRGGLQHSRSHVKSRTLSTGLNAAQLISKEKSYSGADTRARVPSSPHSRSQGNNINPLSIVKTSGTVHTRTSSIPTKFSVHGYESDPWLVHPKQLTQSAWLDTEHSSFYLDTPNGISTPLRRCRATTGDLWMQTNNSEDESPGAGITEGDAERLDLSLLNPPAVNAFVGHSPPRRRRRTMNYNADDGLLFSSILDFSSISKGKASSLPCGISGVASTNAMNGPAHPDNVPGLSDSFAELNLSLASAFSPTASSYGHDNYSNRPTPALATTKASGHPVGYAEETSLPKHVSPSTRQKTTDSNGDKLGNLFSILGIAACRNGTSPASNSTPSSGLANLAYTAFQPREPMHRRKRGDTIRASDYARPTPPIDATVESAYVLNDAAESAQSNTSGNIIKAIRPGRVRSGTITLASFAASSRRGEHDQTHTEKSPRRTHRRSHAVWPAAKMRSDIKPLCVPSDDEDDELLLKAGDTYDS
ncbi:uncharacterized protein FIBRA_04668 [Fibroporia radiculosa]|uniref:Uncharacterized protein n=1 Tax=Fibroporia radiculosa TaxID=599839 RepID=J4GPM1_9APHY|nr:uncharacterized protein FIBRA_04668 [Fibroporia radiculosa]CCM02565.1 predicted protein [Fibroporia radiculosa]